LDGVYSALARIPTFRDVRLETVELEPLGSLTNSTYKVTANGLAYTLRVPGKDTYEYVDRAAEEHNARIMAAAGVNAKVLYFDATDGTMLSEFVEGVNMTETRFRDEPEAPARVALALKRVHRLGPVFKSRFDVFAMIDVYLGILRKLGAPLPEDYHEVEQGARAVRWALDASPMPLSPCHNDPWPGNLLDAGGRLYIIDWEFSGMNDPMWDLGDLSVESGFEPEQDRVMIEAYYGATAPLALYSRLALNKALSEPEERLFDLRAGKTRALQSADGQHRVRPPRERGMSAASRRSYPVPNLARLPERLEFTLISKDGERK
jgi:thiamine kinase-like enzyme